MSFLNNLANQFMHQGGSGQHQQQEQQGYGNQGYPPQGGYGGQQYGGQQHPQNDGRPHPPAPWIAEWDNYENRWVYINRENGQRTHEFPQQGYGGGYQQQSYQQGGYSGGYGGQPQQQMQEQHKSHNGRNMAFGAIAGVAGGALLMHEGEKVHEDWDKDKYRAEERFDDARYDVDYDARRAGNYVEGIPDRVAYDVGRDEQRIEDIPQDVDRKWDNFKQDVDNVPEDIAYGAGDVVGDVDRFGDRLDNAYDDGRDNRRYDDDRNDW